MILVVGLLIFSCSQKKQDKDSSNPIVLENQKEGTTDWLIKVAYDSTGFKPDEHIFRRRKAIEAFCSQAYYVPGDTLKIFISTDPASDYSLQIFRMGYYQGKGGRLIESSGTSTGITQSMPDIDPKTNLLECKWALSYSKIIPTNWLSGVYLGKLTSLKDSSQSYCIFIIQDGRKADINFQCSDLTWQAYNRWPYWHSMYDEGHNPWVNTNGAVISFDRPYALYTNGLPTDFSPLTNGSGEFLRWEFPLSFWLEKEGYDVTYTSNINTQSLTHNLLNTKIFLSVAHDEYWTPQMYANVKNARDNGLNLFFLSGNSLDGTVYLIPSTDGRPNRITGRLPQREFDNEQHLMGASSYGVGYTDWVVKNANHWIYEGTGLKDNDTIKDLVGWEYHGLPLTDSFNIQVLAQSAIKPNVYKAADALDHAATIYTLSGGNFVFNAGSCWWPLAIDSPPGKQNPVNNQGERGKTTLDFSKPNGYVQQMTKNLISKALKK
ncbi:MAG: DUF6605 domain-containing protein [Bacteroidota bacterium]|nr:DUF6605 domain-containing protein [Bacteroidota bacterium]